MRNKQREKSVKNGGKIRNLKKGERQNSMGGVENCSPNPPPPKIGFPSKTNSIQPPLPTQPDF